MRKKYAQQAYNHIVDILHDAPRPGRPLEIDSRVETNIALIACSDAPEGAARWTLHLIADRLVQLKVLPSISNERVRQALKKTA